MSAQAETPVAVVTGASQGIGYAIAAELARRGHRLALLARNPDRLRQAADRLRSQASAARAFPCDVADATRVRDTCKQLLDWAGRCDVLVNNAGVGAFAPVQELSEEDWDRTLDTNLRGVFLCSRALIPRMIEQKSGYIINIASLAGKNAVPQASAYCASKWGLIGLTKCMAEELRPHGIRVSVISPGTVRTEGWPHAGKNPGKMLHPEDVARAAGWLLDQDPRSFPSEIDLRPTQKP